jgi:hypothetical protein
VIVILDDQGDLLEDPIRGLPRCWTDSTDCAFLFPDDARGIAKKAGFDGSIGDWAALKWDGRSPSGYAWELWSVIAEGHGTVRRRILKIEATTGEIYDVREYD